MSAYRTAEHCSECDRLRQKVSDLETREDARRAYVYDDEARKAEHADGWFVLSCFGGLMVAVCAIWLTGAVASGSKETAPLSTAALVGFATILGGAHMNRKRLALLRRHREQKYRRPPK